MTDTDGMTEASWGRGRTVLRPQHTAGAGRTGGVLVIVRDEAVRAVLSDALADEGYATASAGDGVTGLLLAAERAPDLLLLDLRLARAAGGTFVDWCRHRPEPRPPLLLLSAGKVPELVDAAERMGAAGFLELPFELDDLLALVARLVAPTPALVPAMASVAPAETGERAARTTKQERETAAEAERRRLLGRLAQDVQAHRAAVARVREALPPLVAREAAGRLSREDRARLTALRRESEALRLQLRQYHREYERLRPGRTDEP